jgi:HK97 family phage prohead protease
MEYKATALSFASTAPQFRKLASGAMAVEGYGSAFGGPPDSYGDIIQAGAFARSLAEYRAAGKWPKMFWSHDARQVTGLWTSMSEDQYGLVVAGVLADTSLGRDLNALVELGAVDALSIGFSIPAGGFRYELGSDNRIITEIDLHEVSLVALPANKRAQLNSAPMPSRMPAVASRSHVAVDDALAKLQQLVLVAEAEESGKVVRLHSEDEAEAAIIEHANALCRSIRRKH